MMRTADGIDACHVRDRDMLARREGRSRPGQAYAEDRSLVTVNVDDFVALAPKREFHAGLILIEDSSLHRDEQLAIIRAAVRFIEGHDLVNRVLWINLDGSMEFEDIPPIWARFARWRSPPSRRAGRRLRTTCD